MHALPFKVMSRPLPLDSALASESCLGQVLPCSVEPWFKSPNKSSLIVNLMTRINGCKTKLPALATVATQLLLMLSHHCLPVARPALALRDLLRVLTVLITQYKQTQSGSLRQGWSSEAGMPHIPKILFNIEPVSSKWKAKESAL